MRVSEHANYLLNEYGRLQFDYAAYCKPNGESLRNEARNNLEEYIAELEAENDRLQSVWFYDALEKDYADVCQKRLEAAEVWSRQIIELARIAELEAALVSSGNQQGLYLEELFDLRKRIAELEAAQRWIPVSERLPEEGEGVVVAVEGGFVYPDTFDCVSEGILHFYDSCNVTHWMPLPEPPEVELGKRG